MDELARKRWERKSSPQDHGPREALEAALDAFEKEQPDHVIVVFGKTCEEKGDRTHFFQAGSYSHHGQLGLITEAAALMRENG